jgi:uncharacterized protein YybS (DUF2232 family)
VCGNVSFKLEIYLNSSWEITRIKIITNITKQIRATYNVANKKNCESGF